MISSGEGGTPAAAWGHKAGSVGALIAYVQQRPAPHTVALNLGAVKAPTLTPDNDDDYGALGYWRWRSMVMQIVAWGTVISLAALFGMIGGDSLEALSMRASAGSIDPFLIILVVAVLAALAFGYGLHLVLERRRAKQNELEDLQRRAVAVIQPNE